MKWEKIVKNRMAKDPVKFANEILDEIIYERIRLNQDEMEIIDADYPFDFNIQRKEFEKIIKFVNDTIDEYYMNE